MGKEDYIIFGCPVNFFVSVSNWLKILMMQVNLKDRIMIVSSIPYAMADKASCSQRNTSANRMQSSFRLISYVHRDLHT